MSKEFIESLDALDGKTIGGMKIYVYAKSIEFSSKEKTQDFAFTGNRTGTSKIKNFLNALYLKDAEAENRAFWDQMKESLPANSYLNRKEGIYFPLAEADVSFKTLTNEFKEQMQSALEAVKKKAKYLK